MNENKSSPLDIHQSRMLLDQRLSPSNDRPSEDMRVILIGRSMFLHHPALFLRLVCQKTRKNGFSSTDLHFQRCLRHFQHRISTIMWPIFMIISIVFGTLPMSMNNPQRLSQIWLKPIPNIHRRCKQVGERCASTEISIDFSLFSAMCLSSLFAGQKNVLSYLRRATSKAEVIDPQLELDEESFSP